MAWMPSSSLHGRIYGVLQIEQPDSHSLCSAFIFRGDESFFMTVRLIGSEEIKLHFEPFGSCVIGLDGVTYLGR